MPASHEPPLTHALWRAHAAAKKLEGQAPTPEAVEAIGKAAIAAYLEALAAENKVSTGHVAGIDGGDSWEHRSIYSTDLERLAAQTREAAFVGERPGGEPRFGW